MNQTQGKDSIFDKLDASVSILLNIVMVIVIGLAVCRLLFSLGLALYDWQSIQDYKTIKNLFGMVMVVFIALEFSHILRLFREKASAIHHMRIVIVIAILAIVRKFIILDTELTGALTIFALAASIIALGGTYWLMKPRKTTE